jgi:outer membrane protein TolC
MITSIELTDAQLALAQAEVNRLQSLHDYVVGLSRLEKAIGQTLQK